MPRRPDPAVAARRLRELEMRAAGLTYAQIAEAEGHKTAAAAVQDVTRALADRKAWLDEQASLFVALEIERLDSMQRRVETVIAAAVKTGDHLTVLRGVNSLVRVSGRRGRLLGLDVPSQLIVRNAPERPAPARKADGIDEIAARRARRRGGAG